MTLRLRESHLLLHITLFHPTQGQSHQSCPVLYLSLRGKGKLTFSAVLHGAWGGCGGDVAVLRVLRAAEEVVERLGVAVAKVLDEAQELDLYRLKT